MKRRNVLAALGTLSAGGVFIAGSGAFTSVSANRDVTVSVTGDANAYLRLAPCTINGDEQPNGDYVTGATDGAMAIELSASNDQVGGEGVNPEALSVFDNVFEICNQGTQPVCVDFSVDVPVISNGTDVPNRYDFNDGDLAVVFYRGDDPDNPINVDRLDTDSSGAIPLDVGECQCIGFEVRAFGFGSTTDLFEDAELEILAQAGASCGDGGTPTPELEKTWADSVDSYAPGTTKNGDPIGSSRSDPGAATGAPDVDFVSLGFGGELVVGFDEELVKRGLDTDACLIETTNGRDRYPEEKALVEVAGPGTNGSYETVGVATNKASNGTNTFELPAAPITKVRLTDQTDPALHNGNADGFDVDAVGGWTETS